MPGVPRSTNNVTRLSEKSEGRVPGMLPTTTVTLALVVCVGLFQATTLVFETTVPFVRLGLRTARNRSSTNAPGASGPLTELKFAVIREPATLTPDVEPFIDADPFTSQRWP